MNTPKNIVEMWMDEDASVNVVYTHKWLDEASGEWASKQVGYENYPVFDFQVGHIVEMFMATGELPKTETYK